MNFRVIGLDATPFIPLYVLSDDALKTRGVMRYTVEHPHSAPDRIELKDAQVGQTVLLLNHRYLDIASPYQGTHAIFVREGATQQFNQINQIPDCIRRRLMSLRSFDNAGMMLDADVVEGTQIEFLIERLLSNNNVTFIQAHHAKRGCYAARIERA